VFEAIKAAAAHFLLRFSGFWVMGPDWMGVWGLGWIVAWALLSAVLALIAAWGLYERRPWGRTAGIISAVFALVHPLFGTVLGIYTLVLLLSGEAADQYARLARA
jgi:ABC-type spermidine/putrescine transport system permease subunit II